MISFLIRKMLPRCGFRPWLPAAAADSRARQAGSCFNLLRVNESYDYYSFPLPTYSPSGRELGLILATPTATKGPESRSWDHHSGDQSWGPRGGQWRGTVQEMGAPVSPQRLWTSKIILCWGFSWCVVVPFPVHAPHLPPPRLPPT